MVKDNVLYCNTWNRKGCCFDIIIYRFTWKFCRGGQLGKCLNVCFICTQKPGIHCPSIRLRPFLLQIEAGIMSYSRMCLDWVTLCANWQGFKLTTTTKTLLGGFALENSMCWPTSPTTWSFHSIFLAMIFVCYKDSIPPKIMWFGMGLLWRFCGEKWGSRHGQLDVCPGPGWF